MKKATVAILSDIHSNYHAFLACFNDAVKNGAEKFIFLGDYVSDLSQTEETMRLLFDIMSKYPCHLLRGNRERYMLECREGKIEFNKGSKSGSLLYTYNHLQKEDLELFENLPIYNRINIDGIDFEIAHSLKNNDRYYYDKNSDIIQEVFDQMDSLFFITGHSHHQYIINKGEKTIINPGSVGVPRVCGGISQYALLRIANGNVECELKEIPYNIKETVKHQFSSGLTDISGLWGISILYDIITGKEYTMELLSRVLEYSNGDNTLINDESVWKRFAKEMCIDTAEQKILQMI